MEYHADNNLRTSEITPGSGTTPMSTPAANRNLLLGILALQMDFISREQLVAATSKWLTDKSRPIEEILAEQNALSESDRRLLAPLVARHIENHDGDPEKSLAAVSSIGSLTKELRSLNDPQLEATLAVVAGDREDGSFGPQEARRTVEVPTSGGSRFRIIRPHARGGLGEVSVAEDTELGREVALKEIQSQFADDPDSRSRFVLEAEVTGGLEHPGIVPVYGLGQYDDGRPYYAMRFIRGDSLQEAANRFHNCNTAPQSDADDGEVAGTASTADSTFDSLAFRKLLGRFVDVCNAIEYAHSRGVLHRDLKPGNIMLGKYGETLVVDWGLAKLKGRDDETRIEGETTLLPGSGSGTAPTQMGIAVGTPAFMPPEQAAGRLDALGPASDVYSLGATLYYVLTSQSPIQGKSLPEILKKVQSGEFPRPRELKPDVPKPLEAICLRAMQTDPRDRYASPRELAEDIERFLADEPVESFREPVALRARRWIRKHPKSVTGLAATLLVGLISSAAIGLIVSQNARIVRGKNQDLASANVRLDESNRKLTDANENLDDSKAQLEEKNRDLEKANESELQAKEDALAVIDFFQDNVLARARPESQKGGLGIDATIRAAVDAAEPDIAESFKDRPSVEASIRNSLGLTYLYLGEGELAIVQHERARVLRQEKLGPEHPDTLHSMNRLAYSYQSAGRLEEALSLNEETLKLRKKKLGPEHRDTLMSMGNLANSYKSAGRLDEALSLHEETFKLRKKKLGPEHPSTLMSMGLGQLQLQFSNSLQ